MVVVAGGVRLQIDPDSVVAGDEVHAHADFISG